MIVALVGLCGSGKSEASKYFLDDNYEKVYFGGITIEEVKRRGLEVNEANERTVREELRDKHGMAAYAVLSLPKIEKAISEGKNVLIDGLYSWSEYKILKDKFTELKVVSIYTNPELRYHRLSIREVRPLTKEQAMSRDIAEIENLEKAGPIAKADFTIINNGTIEELLDKIKRLFA
mgnify:CR=1 FL=1